MSNGHLCFVQRVSVFLEIETTWPSDAPRSRAFFRFPLFFFPHILPGNLKYFSECQLDI